MPPNSSFGNPAWSADGRQIALLNATANSIELWILNAETARLRKIPRIVINSAHGEAVQWMPDQRSLLIQTVPAGRGKPPAAPAVPKGPTIQENLGGKAPVWTFEDLLKNVHDENLFDYYATAQLGIVDPKTGKWNPIGKPGIFQGVDASPDGKLLLVSRLNKPYSYLVTASSFPKEVEVWNRAGAVVHKLASLPLQEQVPTDGVPVGPRSHRWKATEPATLVWVEALDEGNPRAKVPFRDKVLMLREPFQEKPIELARTEFRFGGISWGEKNDLALLSEFGRPTRRSRTWQINAARSGETPRKIWDRNMQDRYNDPGSPLMRMQANGQRVLRQNGDSLFLSGQGASPKGSLPFLDEFDLKTLQSKRIYRCSEGSYESIMDILADDGSKFLTRYETPSEPPNIFLRSGDGSERRALTAFKNPTPLLRKIRKQLVTYKREDGVRLSFTLYRPPDYKEGERLPTVIWAYPME